MTALSATDDPDKPDSRSSCEKKRPSNLLLELLRDTIATDPTDESLAAGHFRNLVSPTKT